MRKNLTRWIFFNTGTLVSPKRRTKFFFGNEYDNNMRPNKVSLKQQQGQRSNNSFTL
jgi:hypothetical protein